MRKYKKGQYKYEKSIAFSVKDRQSDKKPNE